MPDVERGEPVCEGVRDDKPGVVRCDRHAVREGEVARRPAYRTVGSNQHHDAAGRLTTTEEVELDAVDVAVPPTVHDDLVANPRRARRSGRRAPRTCRRARGARGSHP
jgi:hypothetical protein